jgi:hypothetical protein
MKKCFLRTLALALFLSLAGYIQATTTNVTAGTGTLSTAVSSASSGDVLVLASGGTYTETSGISIDSKDITIKAADDASVMPILILKEFDIKGTGTSLTCSGIDIQASSGASYTVYYVSGFVSGALTKFSGCKISGYGRNLIRGDNTTGTMSQIVVDNCIIHDMGFSSTNYAVFLTKSGKVYFGSIAITNSTFYHCDAGFIRDENTNGTVAITIDRCTLDNPVAANGNFVKLAVPTGSSLAISNSIITNMGISSGFWSGTATTMSITNTFYYGANMSTFESSFTGTKTNFIESNPLYADASSADFTVGSTTALTYSTTGGLIGDPRWAPPTVSGSPSSLSFYYQTGNGPSAKQNILVSGERIGSGGVVVTPPSNYEISSDGSTFQTSAITLSPSNRTVSATVYIRLKTNLSAGDYNGNIVLSSSGATSVNVACYGTVGEIPPPPNVIINEFLADPRTTIDANGDGAYSATDDQFIELYNAESTPVEISFFTIVTSSGLKHTFPINTFIYAGEVMVVFGGGTPTGFASGVTEVASTGALGLSTSSDQITLYDRDGNVVDSYSYNSGANDNQSLTLDNGVFVKYTLATGAVSGELASPGKTNAGTYYTTPSSTAVPVSWACVLSVFLLIGVTVVARKTKLL